MCFLPWAAGKAGVNFDMSERMFFLSGIVILALEQLYPAEYKKQTNKPQPQNSTWRNVVGGESSWNSNFFLTHDDYLLLVINYSWVLVIY